MKSNKELVTVTGRLIELHYHLVDADEEYSKPYDNIEDVPVVQGCRLARHVTIEEVADGDE